MLGRAGGSKRPIALLGKEENNEKNNNLYRLKSELAGHKAQWIDRSGEPEEIGTICVFLSSSWASFITGAEICADGGFTIGGGYKVPSFDWSTITEIIGKKE